LFGGLSETMALRNNITFRVAMPFDAKLHPVGAEVATYLANAIERRTGLHAAVDDWRDSGYQLDFVINNKPMHFSFCFIEDPRFQFYGQVASYVGWLRRFFGYRDQEEEEMLIRAVEETLKSDPIFSDVYWHEAWYDEAKMTQQP
jgi:hypothetical protein